jgi:hypothetical protein
MLTFGSETCTVGNHGEILLRSVERKAVLKIFGAVLENGFTRRRKNSEICKLCDE